MMKWINLAFLWLVLQFVQGYVVTQTPPTSDMFEVGTVLQSTVYNASGGSLVAETRQVEIIGYVVWYNPNREPEYLIDLGGGAWSIWNLATVEQFSVVNA